MSNSTTRGTTTIIMGTRNGTGQVTGKQMITNTTTGEEWHHWFRLVNSSSQTCSSQRGHGQRAADI